MVSIFKVRQFLSKEFGFRETLMIVLHQLLHFPVGELYIKICFEQGWRTDRPGRLSQRRRLNHELFCKKETAVRVRCCIIAL